MQKTHVCIRTGNREFIIADVEEGDVHLQRLVRLATASNRMLTLDIPLSEDSASALGHLLLAKSNSDVPSSGPAALEVLPVLSKKLREFTFSKRASGLFLRLGLVYVWQVVEKDEVYFLRHKNCGRGTLSNIKFVLSSQCGLRLGMDLSAMRPHLPMP